MASTGKAVSKLVIGLVTFIGLPLLVWGGDMGAFLREPARLWYVVFTVVLHTLIVIRLPDSGRWTRGERTVSRQRLAIFLLMLLSLALMPLAPWCDRRGVLVLGGGETLRWVGLNAYCLGIWITHWAEATLGRQFSVEVTIQEGHTLVTGGPYRWLRHPRYSGIILYMAGVALTFRSWLGLALVGGMALVLLWRIRDEDQLLHEQFGAEWEAWAARTKKLAPFV
ncbi:isoprenylcysteine carboxylmethyltransferase family protein, partial [bacterium]|nr:isoprenylcysteine carboxylmethyltransferase family protein [bacterium]